MLSDPPQGGLYRNRHLIQDARNHNAKIMVANVRASIHAFRKLKTHSAGHSLRILQQTTA